MKILLIVCALLLSGCTSGIVGNVKDDVERALAGIGEGRYTVTIAKDGREVASLSYTCKVGADGKLAGCYRE